VAHGGAERYMNAVVAELARRGHEVHIFAHDWDGATATGVTVHRVPMMKAFSFLRAWSFARNCRKAIERGTFDVVFSFERTLRQDVYRAGDGCHREWLEQRRKFSSPLKRLTLRLNPLHAVMLSLEKKVFSPHHTKLVIANSHRGKTEITRHYKFPAANVRVIYNGVDCEKFSPSCREKYRTEVRGKCGIGAEDFVALFVGSGWERKGLEFAIRAVAKSEGVTLLVVGRDRNEAKYRAMARKLGVGERVKFAGTTTEIERFYGAAEVLLLPTIYEPFSNVCLEAMACGLPVITSRANGVAELIANNVNGGVVENPSDTAAIAKWLEFFRGTDLKSAGERARAVARSLPLGQAVTETLEVLENARG
jgi:UDP-glucose:(heptosyl)LPS alpha-1,3-glucosyltransferase